MHIKPRKPVKRDRRFGGSKAKSKKMAWHRNRVTGAITLLAIAVSTLTTMAFVAQTFVKVVSSVHGPHPQTLLQETAPQSVAAAPAPSSLTVPLANGQTTAGTTQGQYGIAAGGGLMYLGQNDLNVYFQKLKQLGVTWVRWDIHWGSIQSQNVGQFDWSGPDRVLSVAANYGIKSLVVITYTPQWARHSACTNDEHCRPADPNQFATFAGKVVERYRDRVNTWEVWNEPNFAYFWKPVPNVQEYTALLRATYKAIKKVDPMCLVLTGGMAASGDEADGSLSPITFVNGIYGNDAEHSFDAISMHPYTFPAAPDYQAWWNRWQQIEPIRQIMVDQGDGSKKIWLTEYGATTKGSGRAFSMNELDGFRYGADYMTEQAQVDLMNQAIAFYEQRRDWLGPFFWYSMQDLGTDAGNTENFFGLLRFDGSRKPAYDVYARAAQ